MRRAYGASRWLREVACRLLLRADDERGELIRHVSLYREPFRRRSPASCCDVVPVLPGTAKTQLAQAIGRAAIQPGHRIGYRERRV
jgi:hypothetical protein